MPEIITTDGRNLLQGGVANSRNRASRAGNVHKSVLGRSRRHAAPAAQRSTILRAIRTPAHESVLDTIGNTPMLKLAILRKDPPCCVYAKAEFMNPSGSVKDRIAKYIVEQAKLRGLLKPGCTPVEATSGNTGIALSMVAAPKGYNMPAGFREARIHRSVCR